MTLQIVVVISGYLFGSFASAVIVCKLMHLDDPRQTGSKNPGATNVLRLHGKTAAILTLAGDVLKGFIPVLIAHTINASDQFIALTGFAAFTGHLFPIFFGFHGGKGVATLFGVLTGTHWLLGAIFMLTWLIVAVISRYSSLSSMVAAALTPVYAYLILTGYEYVIIYSLIVVLLFWRHLENIRNLISGDEHKISFGKSHPDS